MRLRETPLVEHPMSNERIINVSFIPTDSRGKYNYTFKTVAQYSVRYFIAINIKLQVKFPPESHT